MIRNGTLFLVTTALMTACCPQFCPNPDAKCNAVPTSDAIAPEATIIIEFWDASGQPQLQTISNSQTISVSEDQRFNIIYTGRDNVGIKELWLELRWTQWSGSVSQSVTPLVAPEIFGDNACTPRSASSKFTYEGARIYRFTARAKDYHGNSGSSPTLTVKHGQAPTPVSP